MNKSSLKTIWVMFAIFMAIFFINLTVTVIEISATERMWMIINVWALVMAISLLLKNKLPKKNQIVISAILTTLAYGFTVLDMNLYNVFSIILTFIAIISVFSTFNKYKENSLVLIRSEKKLDIGLSIVIGLTLGIVLGFINLLLNSSNLESQISITFRVLLTSFNPAIYEEIVLRTLFFVFCLSLLNGELKTKKQQFTCWFMMIIPHLIIHTPELFLTLDLISALINTLILSFLFAIPFALLQRKRDVASAVIAHGVVVFIRFSVLGLPY